MSRCWRWHGGAEVETVVGDVSVEEDARQTARITIASKTAVRVKTMGVSRVARNQYVKAVETARR